MSDPESPKGIGFPVTPRWAACDGILKHSGGLPTCHVNKGITTQLHDFESHVIGVVESDDGFLAKSGCEVLSQ